MFAANFLSSSLSQVPFASAALNCSLTTDTCLS